MVLGHDTVAALTAAAALVNTSGCELDLLSDVAALRDLVNTWDWADAHMCTDADLGAVRDLRPRLRQFWQIEDEDRVVELINRLLREANAVPQLTRHDCHYHLHTWPADGGLAARTTVAAAMGVAELVYTGELNRLRICLHSGCDNVMVDLSKNRSRRYCENGCGNRAAVTAYRGRKAAANASHNPRR